MITVEGISLNIDNKALREVQIKHFDKKGRGVGETNTGGRLTVPYTIPGETIIADKSRGKLGQIIDVAEPAQQRIQPKCPHFGKCGGCSWQHIDYQEQLEFKRNTIKTLLEQWNLPSPEMEIHASDPFYYRNRMDYVWWYDGKLGLRQAGKWHAMEALDECHLLPEDLMNIVFEINRRVQGSGLPFRDQKRKTPGLRYLIIRHGVFTNDVMVNIVSDPLDIPKSLLKGLPIKSAYQLVNDNLENDASDGLPNHLKGSYYYREKILDHTFHVGPQSFFQPNPAVANEMARWIEQRTAALPNKNALLDLYCGVGVFSKVLAKHFDQVLGIESSEDAIHHAEFNLQADHVDFKCADAESFLPEQWMEFDTLVVDPPRSGLHQKVMRTLLKTSFKNIFYVSCNPRRGIEDIAKLSEQYQIADIKLFDQFPQTAHVEMIVQLKSKY